MEEQQIPKVKANPKKDTVLAVMTMIAIIAIAVAMFNIDELIGSAALIFSALLIIPIRKIQFWEYKGLSGDGTERLNAYLASQNVFANVSSIHYPRNGYRSGYPRVTLNVVINGKEDILFGWWIIDTQTQETTVVIEYDKCDFTCEDMCGHEAENQYSDVRKLDDKLLPNKGQA